ncbi:hypothetical protein RsoM2USA_152 [Ralstonia phage RsoM2USA]|nr:hypothetical protein RsoM2USA_152 [Ralstonia phage RsoM2USA]
MSNIQRLISDYVTKADASEADILTFYQKMMDIPLEEKIEWNSKILEDIEMHQLNPVNKISNFDPNDLTTQGKKGIIQQIVQKIRSVVTAPTDIFLASVYATRRNQDLDLYVDQTFLFVPLVDDLDDDQLSQLLSTYGIS